MKKIVFTEEFCQPENLFPLTLTRHVQDIRVGILTLREKWELALGMPSLDKHEGDYKDTENSISIEESIGNDTIYLIHGNVLPTARLIKQIYFRAFPRFLIGFERSWFAIFFLFLLSYHRKNKGINRAENKIPNIHFQSKFTSCCDGETRTSISFSYEPTSRQLSSPSILISLNMVNSKIRVPCSFAVTDQRHLVVSTVVMACSSWLCNC